MGLQMSDDRAGAVVAECLDNGMLLNAVRPNMLRFMPPLNVSREEIDEAVSILDAAFAKGII